MLSRLVIFFRWIGFAALIAVTFRFIVFLVKLVYNPYTVELREDHFFIDALCALAVMGIDYLYHERFRQANPNISLGTRPLRKWSATKKKNFRFDWKPCAPKSTYISCSTHSTP